MKKKRSLRNENLEANRASETEEQRKERLRIRHENVKTENHEKQRLATLKRLKRDDDNELKRNLRDWRRLSLVNSLVGRGDRRRRLENDAAILCLSFKLDVLTT